MGKTYQCDREFIKLENVTERKNKVTNFKKYIICQKLFWIPVNALEFSIC